MADDAVEELHREASSAPLPNAAQYSKDAASQAQQAVQRSRSGLNRLSAGLSRLGAGILSGLHHSQSSAQQRSSAPGGAVAPHATSANPRNGNARSPQTPPSNRSLPGSSGSLPTPTAPPLVASAATQGGGASVLGTSSAAVPAPDADAAAASLSGAEVDGVAQGGSGGQGHDRSPVASGAAQSSAGDTGLGGGGCMEDVTPGFWPGRLHESIKVRK